MIKVNDPVYGTFELPALFDELLNTAAIQRLGKIHHSGAIFLVNPEITHTRLEHSIGVMLLIRVLGGSELEQVAGLVHDISHTVFSHVGDYIFDNAEETYHEQLFESVIKASEIPVILEKYGYHIDQLINGSFELLEQPLPHLCADRLDYTLRDSIHAKLITRQHARSFINTISTQDGKIVVNGATNAAWINHTFERLNKDFFNAPLYVYANQHLALIIRNFLKTGEIKETDLLKDDTFILNKIRSSTYGFEAIKGIKQHRDYPKFLKKGPSLKIKSRYLIASVAEEQLK